MAATPQSRTPTAPSNNATNQSRDSNSNIALSSNESAAVMILSSPPASSFWAPPSRLALSAYRRPECTVRLTDADPTMFIHSKYDLPDPSICWTLGHGASSTVRLAYRRFDDQPVAIKTIAKHDALGLWTKSDRWNLNRRFEPSTSAMNRKATLLPRLEEVDVLTSLRDICPNVVQLLDVYETDHEVQLVLEYCGGGDLFDVIKRRRQQRLRPGLNGMDGLSSQGIFTESEVSTVARTLLTVLKALHSRHIVHRDIKPENILLVNKDHGGRRREPMEVKLTDFGLARILHQDIRHFDRALELSQSSCEKEALSQPIDEEHPRTTRSRAHSCVGSDYYTAPEVTLGLGYDTPIDIYSLGITLYVMLCGSPPPTLFPPDNTQAKSCLSSCSPERQSGAISGTNLHYTGESQADRTLFSAELNISPLAQDLVYKMIHCNPDQRITAEDALKHEWIIQHSFQDSYSEFTEEMRVSPAAGEANAFLSDSIQDSLCGISPEIASLSDSSKRIDDYRCAPEFTTNPLLAAASNGAVTSILTGVCDKLTPLVAERRLRKRRRHRLRVLSQTDEFHHGSKKQSLGFNEGATKKKKFHSETNASSSPHVIHHLAPPNSSCANNRIGRRFNSSTPSVAPLNGSMLPQKNVAVKGAN